MTKQIFRSAQGQSIDLGTIKLRNEHVRAVGNMNVNARGDILNGSNQVIETKSRQIQKQNARLTNVVDTPVHTSSAAARRARAAEPADNSSVNNDNAIDNTIVVAGPTPVDLDPVVNPSTNNTVTDTTTTGGGLAAAIARSKIVKQEKEKTARQAAQDNQGVRRI